jgi:hypothetical protein
MNNEDDFIPGSLIQIIYWDSPVLYTIISKWKINSHEYLYRILSQRGKLYETKFDSEYWSKIQ